MSDKKSIFKPSQVIKIKVLNFDKRNKKAIGATVPWFRCESRLARSPEFLSLSPGAKHLWLWLVCEAAQSSSRVVWCVPRDVSREVHVKPHNIPSVIRELTHLEWIQVLTSPTNERTNDTNVTDDIESTEVDPSPTGNIASNKSDEPPEPAEENFQLTALPVSETRSSSKKPKPPEELHWLGAVWNEHCGKRLQKIKTTSSRMKNISKRVGEQPDPEYWVGVVKKAADSKFLTGLEKQVFHATFDWLISLGKDGNLNHVKVDEGNYANKAAHQRDVSPEAMHPPGHYDDMEKYSIRSDMTDDEYAALLATAAEGRQQ